MVGPSPPGRTHPWANYKQPTLRSQLLLCCSEQSSSLAKGNVFLGGFLPFYPSSQQVLSLPPELPNLGKIDPQWALLRCVGPSRRLPLSPTLLKGGGVLVLLLQLLAGGHGAVGGQPLEFMAEFTCQNKTLSETAGSAASGLSALSVWLRPTARSSVPCAPGQV